MENKPVVQPLVTVLLPIFNAEKTLERTLYHLINQTFKNLEILAIDDGSTDNSLHILKKHQLQDKRIKIISRENKGLIKTLNEGLDHAKGEFIVREDSDDYSALNRIEIQVLFMQQNTEIAAAGSYNRCFGSSHELKKYPTDKNICKATLLFYPCLAHPSVILRNAFLLEKALRYPLEYKHCEDYALWVNIIKAGGHIANIPKELHYYNNHPQQVSVKNNKETSLNHYKLISNQLNDIGICIDNTKLRHMVITDKKDLEELTLDIFKDVIIKCEKILKNATDKGYENESMKSVLMKLIIKPIKDKLGISGYFVYVITTRKFHNPFDLGLIYNAFLRTIKNTVKRFKYD
ncbi:MAG: glycosyltransferase family 2 protein [Paraglaciecola sp.]|uniref:glycosyltransferase family 2 protein n=1 Tax=Paraglaciecola sp. TaxID=1920173 RepID=UPI00273DD56A|nr:glycosyltransferase family 2 protein [Paraglaciecola sp.]MDP5030745.1 glycosyltransferase family 2 protein [Paraglaciecola sp.]MDP5132305.1 glycosyltransferase family 2 protein [Paraglaciecola sp.]